MTRAFSESVSCSHTQVSGTGRSRKLRYGCSSGTGALLGDICRLLRCLDKWRLRASVIPWVRSKWLGGEVVGSPRRRAAPGVFSRIDITCARWDKDEEPEAKHSLGAGI